MRFNGTSDLPWEKVFPMKDFPQVMFYDYTKNPGRMANFTQGKLPANYHLTFSRSEENEALALDVLAQGGNVAAVFDTKKGQDLPPRWKGFKIIDGDLDDVRFTDPTGVIIGLRAKGDAIKDETGFVIQL